MPIPLPLPPVPFRIQVDYTREAKDHVFFARDDKNINPTVGTVDAINLGHLRVTWDCAPAARRWVDRDFVHLI